MIHKDVCTRNKSINYKEVAVKTCLQSVSSKTLLSRAVLMQERLHFQDKMLLRGEIEIKLSHSTCIFVIVIILTLTPGAALCD